MKNRYHYIPGCASWILGILLLTVSFCANSQRCNISIRGFVRDTSVNKPVEKATIRVDNMPLTVTDSRGAFSIGGICAGKHIIVISEVSHSNTLCELYVSTDTTIVLLLSEKSNVLGAVSVTGFNTRKPALTTLASTVMKGQDLFNTRGATLGESLKGITGLNTLQTGPSVSKPVIHGLHSNRVLILNNGVRQEGQQWGSEHAPEIDPFIASEVSIVKGASSVRYGSDAIAGVVLLEPEALNPARQLQGQVNAVAATNGRMGVMSGMLEGKLDKRLDGLNWRVQGTLKRAGNFRTPGYYLKNTGISEADFSAAVSYKKSNYGIDLYYSEFHNKLGVFDGSHVGNVSDLYAAFERPRPITASYFSYKIDRSYQDVSHRLLKAGGWYRFNNGSRLEVVFARQGNRRDEYDIDLPYSTDPDILKMPQISFKIKTHTLDVNYDWASGKYFSGSIGVSGGTQGNVFNGIRYLVPNFRNYSGGVYAIEKYTYNKLTLEAGARYDYRWLRVYRLNNNTLQTYYTTHDYRNVTGTAGAGYKFTDHFSINANVGSAWRAPSVNELYIDGIHLSAASYEKGDSLLKSERSYNFTFGIKYERSRFRAEAVAYYNVINDFIYAKPALKPVTLISGTYPLFSYTQDDVTLKGVDVDLSYKPVRQVELVSKTSIVRAWNRTIHDYLVFMPADRFDNKIQYNIGSLGRVRDCYLSLQNISVRRQDRVPPNSDYVAPPPGYSLFNISTGFTIHISGNSLNINLGVDNVANVAYRDYLNRFRYYANDLGMNVMLRAKYVF
ncbi:TonB-dependent receptor [Filimonas effusa]|uniref:TonB-dependent receptor n=1 Tax=Filimonas effusa TaxID=2508721 RepID=A0A4Q1D9D0_9BACT|nr:TonB-dependent receptor [Filimonas effusa]RXK85438.1 TonB-dependent receptor [Filimonas effusa]